MKCRYCQGSCIKKGKINRIQRYQCKTCGKTQQRKYTKFPIKEIYYHYVKSLITEGCSISSTGRLLNISKSSVQRIITRIASKHQIKYPVEEKQQYEIDKLYTYCNNKKNECWIIYAINKLTGKVIDFNTGRRTKENISKVVNAVLLLNPSEIHTDKLNIYPCIIPSSIHKTFNNKTNKIERFNLNLRTHLKRLNRKTICYTKSKLMLENCIKLYCFR